MKQSAFFMLMSLVLIAPHIGQIAGTLLSVVAAIAAAYTINKGL